LSFHGICDIVNIFAFEISSRYTLWFVSYIPDSERLNKTLERLRGRKYAREAGLALFCDEKTESTTIKIAVSGLGYAIFLYPFIFPHSPEVMI
jgi:hypothetical protein